MADPATPRSARGLLAVIAIFALGVVFGAALSFAILHHTSRLGRMGRGHDGPMAIERMTRRLDLDAGQQKEVRAILEHGHAKVRGFMDDTRQEIRAVLRPDQREKFDRIRRPEPPR